MERGGVVLGRDQAEAGQDIAVERRAFLAAGEGGIVHAGIDEGKGDAGGIGAEDEARPKLLLGPDREVGAPVGEEVARGAWGIQRGELVDGAGWQVAGEDLGRGAGIGSYEKVDIRL